MPEVPRISAQEARRRVQQGQAVLACAYDDEAKCAQMRLEGAIDLRELREMLPSLPKDREIVLYCA
ncbi:MAG TPA: ArsR family transcriptional regulator [Methylomirabilota bacterium]|jgi:hypothetical protein|nr:ArsR family transcriptional regulator [Methylomirabilota bacterium]